jgi:hypothetical protein
VLLEPLIRPLNVLKLNYRAIGLDRGGAAHADWQRLHYKPESIFHTLEFALVSLDDALPGSRQHHSCLRDPVDVGGIRHCCLHPWVSLQTKTNPTADGFEINAPRTERLSQFPARFRAS